MLSKNQQFSIISNYEDRHSFFANLNVKCLLILFILFSLFLSVTTKAEARWRTYKSDTLEVVSNLPSRSVKKMISEMENMHDHLSVYLDLDPNTPSVPLRLYLTRSFAKVKKATGIKHISGIYISSLEGIRAAALGSYVTEEWQLSYKEISYHEYVHYILDQKYKHALPKWYLEGLADYLSTGTYLENSMVVGKPLEARRKFLEEQNNWMQLSEMFDDALYPDLHHKYRLLGNKYYALSWLLVHMMHSESQYSEKLPEFVKLISTGVDSETAFQVVYDRTLHDIRRHLRNYFRSVYLKPPRQIYNKVNHASIQSKKLTSQHNNAVQWQILTEFANDHDSYEFIIQKMTEINHGDMLDNVYFQITLLKAYIGKNDFIMANRQLGILSRLKSKKFKNEIAILDQKVALMSQVYAKHQSNLPYEKNKMMKIRSDLEKLVINHPYNPMIHYLHGLSHMVGGEGGQATVAVSALERAHELIPNNTQVQYLLAQASMDVGSTDKACELFNHILITGLDDLYLTLAKQKKNELGSCPSTIPVLEKEKRKAG